jgi:hypothetical protein
MTTILDPLTVSSAEDITANSWTSFFVIFVIILAILAIIAYAWHEGKKGLKMIDKQSKQYEDFYFDLQRYIHDWAVTEQAYYAIDRLFVIFNYFPWKNNEQTGILRNEFLIKYKSIEDEINSREEFDPGQVLKK